MIARFIRALFGVPQPPQQKIVIPPPSPPLDPVQWPEPYFSMSLPLDTSTQAINSGMLWYYSIREKYCLVPAKDDTSVLLFPASFKCESVTGDVKYKTAARDDETDPRERVEAAIRIYEHLNSDHPRLVRYLGRTASGYRLEKPNPGPMPFWGPSAADSKVVLALYRQWALQILSALSHIHAHGVFLNNIGNESIWLRSDYSVAVASMLDAGCADLGICGESYPEFQILSQWSPDVLYDSKPEGSAKNDLFDWAMWVYGLMTGGGNPVTGGAGGTPLDIVKREQALQRGEFDEWLYLEEQMLGSVLLKALRGQYETAADVAYNVQEVIEKDGDETYNWQQEVEIARDQNDVVVLRVLST